MGDAVGRDVGGCVGEGEGTSEGASEIDSAASSARAPTAQRSRRAIIVVSCDKPTQFSANQKRLVKVLSITNDDGDYDTIVWESHHQGHCLFARPSHQERRAYVSAVLL